MRHAVGKIWGKTRPVLKNTFLGISTLQNPMDAWIVQEILYEVKPDVLIEAGTYNGGSAVMWALCEARAWPKDALTVESETGPLAAVVSALPFVSRKTV